MHTVAATAPHDVLLGLAVGEGTGPELAAVFEEAVAAFAHAADLAVSVSRAPGLYRTFGGVLAAGLDAAAVERSSDEDVERYQTWVKTVHAEGARAIFRTAFNAQPLYVVRERLACVKVETLPNGDGEILLVRDQTQGFYAGENDRDGSADRITRTTTFSRAHTYRVLDFAVAEATRRFGGRDRIGPVVMAYKFHLLDLRFANWVADYARERGVDVRVYQPDTMNRNLLRGTWRGNAVVVGGNEWGDIMHADLLARAGCANQDERCSENVYLTPELAGLVEYQTVHGSADDIAGRDLVNPTATLRAAAHIFEHQLGVPGFVAALEHALREGAVRTPDVGGEHGTRAVAAHLVERTVTLWRQPPATPSHAGTALVIVDTQRDLLAADGRFAALGLVDQTRVGPLVNALEALVEGARAREVPVVFVRTFGDAHRLADNVARRHERTGRGGYLAAGSDGAAFFGVTPRDTDTVVSKLGYDAFIGTELETHLRARGIEHLVIAGVFTDVCVDALARTAFQKGFRVSVVADATLPLERAQDDALAFMTRFYDATIVPAADAFADLIAS